MSSFGENKFIPIFQSLALSSYVMNATSALQSLLSKDTSTLDEDCLDYLNDILSNALRFIDWIQSGMQ